MGDRHRGRDAALRMLYQSDLTGEPADKVVDDILLGALLDPPLEASARRFAETLFRSAQNMTACVFCLNWAKRRRLSFIRSLLVQRNPF